MKKSDLMGYFVYALMIIVAVTVGVTIIRPAFDSYSALTLPTGNAFLFMLIAILSSIIVNSILIEVGHLIGAKIGKYEVYSTNVLYFNFKKANGKMSFGFASYDGLTGETKIVPLDEEKSNPKPFYYAPIVLFLIEVVAYVTIIVIFGATEKENEVLGWWKTFFEVVLTVGCIIYLYDIFPAILDSKNDGFLMSITSKKSNISAYHTLLKNEYKAYNGEELDEVPVYDEVTNFTIRLNDVALYQRLANGDNEGALSILEKTIASRNNVSDSSYFNATAMKTSIVIETSEPEDAKDYYIHLPLEQKKYIAALESASAVRAYVLVSGLIEESESETLTGLSKAASALRRSGNGKADVDKKLIAQSLEKVKAAHPNWDFSQYNFSEEK